jgi:bifunctional non-homologous end joining protein LigD
LLSARPVLRTRLGEEIEKASFSLMALARWSRATLAGLRHSTLLHRKRDDHAFLYAFDLIELSGEDLRREPLEQRKIELRRLLAETETGLVFNEWIDGEDFDGTTVFERAQSLGLEGIVSKRKDSRYVSGRSPYWLKMKNPASEAALREAEGERGR